MATMTDVPVNELIDTMASELESVEAIKAPTWAQFVKTGHHKERPPQQDNWWHLRSAAILRQIARLGPIGTSKLRNKYGGKKNRGHRPERSYPGSGSIIRTILQQLEEGGLITQAEKGVHKGRVLTPQGQKFISACAAKTGGEKKPAKAKA